MKGRYDNKCLMSDFGQCKDRKMRTLCLGTDIWSPHIGTIQSKPFSFRVRSYRAQDLSVYDLIYYRRQRTTNCLPQDSNYFESLFLSYPHSMITFIFLACLFHVLSMLVEQRLEVDPSLVPLVLPIPGSL